MCQCRASRDGEEETEWEEEHRPGETQRAPKGQSLQAVKWCKEGSKVAIANDKFRVSGREGVEGTCENCLFPGAGP